MRRRGRLAHNFPVAEALRRRWNANGQPSASSISDSQRWSSLSGMMSPMEMALNEIHREEEEVNTAIIADNADENNTNGFATSPLEEEEEEEQKGDGGVEDPIPRNSNFRKGKVYHKLGGATAGVFTKLVGISQQYKWLDPLNMLLIFVCLAVILVTFSILTVNQNTGFYLPRYGQALLFIAAIVSGIRGALLLASGLPLFHLIPTEIKFAIVLDNIVWILSIAMTASIPGQAEASGGDDDKRLNLTGLAALVWSIRLNTHILLNAAVNSLVVHRDENTKSSTKKKSPKTNSTAFLLVPVEEVCKRIQQAHGISLKYKSIMEGMVHAADHDHDGLLTQGDFLQFAQALDVLLLKSFWSANNTNAGAKDLRQKLNYDKLVAASGVQQPTRANSNVNEIDDNDNDDDDEEGGTVISTMFLAIRLLFDSQECFGYATVFMIFASSMIPPLFDFLVGILVNWGIEMANGENGNASNFTLGLSGAGGLFIADEILFYSLSAMTARMISRASARVQSQLVHAVLDSSASFQQKHSPESLAYAFDTALTKIEGVWAMVFMELAFATFGLFLGLFFLSLYNFGYMVFVLTALPFLMSLQPVEQKAINSSARANRSSGRLFVRFQSTIGLRRAAQVGNRQHFISERFHNPLLEEATHDNFLSWLWTYVVQALFSTVGSALKVVTTILFLLLLSRGEIDSGEFFSVTAFVSGVIGPICGLGRFSGKIVANARAIRRITDVLDDAAQDNQDDDSSAPNTSSANSKGPGPISKITLRKDLVFDKVKFSYTPEGPLILKDVSFSVTTGSYVAVLGSSSSGKSTLLSLLMGTQQANEGEIRMDGTPLSSVSLETLRDTVAVVFQEAYVLDGSIRDNISFGSDATMEKIEEAAKQANIDDVIEKLPDKYDTLLGKESTINMSGGQLQRICGIARAVVQDKPLLLLEEAASALDTVTEQKFIETIESLRDQGLTIISVTHHPSTARNADMILVLDKGSVVETGNYEELIEGGGLFSKLASDGNN